VDVMVWDSGEGRGASNRQTAFDLFSKEVVWFGTRLGHELKKEILRRRVESNYDDNYITRITALEPAEKVSFRIDIDLLRRHIPQYLQTTRLNPSSARSWL